MSSEVPLRLSPNEGDHLPYLPPCRHVLTTRSSQECLHRPSRPSAKCPLFERIPGDVRRDILILAFGNRKVHLDLTFRQPRRPVTRDEQHSSHWGELPGIPLCFKAHPTAAFEENDRWLWVSCVCQKVPPRKPPSPDGDAELREPSDDHCPTTHVYECDQWPGERPSECFIGVMGWLLSCRQAYVEGIDVLYYTNCLCISGDLVLSDLPRLLLPERLASVTSLQLTLRLSLDIVDGRKFFDDAPFTQLLTLISSSCPRLRDFSAFADFVPSQVDVEMDVQKQVVLPLDNFSRSLPDLRDLIVKIPALEFGRFDGNVIGMVGVERRTSWPRGRAWRSLEGVNAVTYDCGEDYDGVWRRLSRPARGLGYWITCRTLSERNDDSDDDDGCTWQPYE